LGLIAFAGKVSCGLSLRIAITLRGDKRDARVKISKKCCFYRVGRSSVGKAIAFLFFGHFCLAGCDWQAEIDCID